jgi:hypothetical protein
MKTLILTVMHRRLRTPLVTVYAIITLYLSRNTLSIDLFASMGPANLSQALSRLLKGFGHLNMT